MSEEKIQTHVLVSGIVQGVFFRAEAQKAANENNVTGWIKNLESGDVEAVFEGTKPEVDKLVEWCQNGSDPAFVTNVEAKEQSPISNFESFEIK